MRYGLYLLSRGLITADQLVQAMQKQEESLPPFGQLAMEEGMLSVRDVFRILGAQSDFALAQFGQTAMACFRENLDASGSFRAVTVTRSVAPQQSFEPVAADVLCLTADA